MTLEITRGKSLYQYRIDPEDPRNVQYRPNRHNARWTFYLRRDTAKEAKEALLQLEKETKP